MLSGLRTSQVRRAAQERACQGWVAGRARCAAVRWVREGSGGVVNVLIYVLAAVGVLTLSAIVTGDPLWIPSHVGVVVAHLADAIESLFK